MRKYLYRAIMKTSRNRYYFNENGFNIDPSSAKFVYGYVFQKGKLTFIIDPKTEEKIPVYPDTVCYRSSKQDIPGTNVFDGDLFYDGDRDWIVKNIDDCFFLFDSKNPNKVKFLYFAHGFIVGNVFQIPNSDNGIYWRNKVS